MASLLSVSELETRLNTTFSGGELDQVTALLEDISDEIRDIASPFLDTVVAPDAPGVIKRIITGIVVRAQENPRGLTGENLGDYGWQAQGSASGAFCSPAEVKRIRRAVGKLGVSGVEQTSYFPTNPSEFLY